MPTLSAAIDITGFEELALTKKAANERTTVTAQAQLALREFTKAVAASYDGRLEPLIRIANTKATDAEKVALVAQLEAIAGRP
jgi:hypothetical protein